MSARERKGARQPCWDARTFSRAHTIYILKCEVNTSICLAYSYLHHNIPICGMQIVCIYIYIYYTILQMINFIPFELWYPRYLYSNSHFETLSHTANQYEPRLVTCARMCVCFDSNYIIWYDIRIDLGLLTLERVWYSDIILLQCVRWMHK